MVEPGAWADLSILTLGVACSDEHSSPIILAFTLSQTKSLKLLQYMTYFIILVSKKIHFHVQDED